MNGTARSALLGTGYVAAYVALDALSFVQPLLKLGITPWNPDAGLTLAFLVARGWRQAPWTAAAALLAELLVHRGPGSTPTLIGASLVIALGYGSLAFALERRRFDPALASKRSALELGLGTALAALAVASGYAALFALSDLLPAHSVVDAIARNWVGDVNGVLTLTPLLLAAPFAASAVPAVRAQGILALCQVAVLAALMWFVLRASPSQGLLLYVLFAPVIWITLSWGVTGACAAALAIQTGFLLDAAGHENGQSLVQTQYFLLTVVLTTVLLGAVLAERARALERVAAGQAEQKALLAAAPDAVLATDLAGSVTTVNPAAEQLFAAVASDMEGSKLSRWLPLHALTEPLKRRTGASRADGQTFFAEIARVRLDPPARPGYLFVVRDMTEHDLAQIQTRERDRTLSRAMRFALAGELATALTHELNQPITALVSYLRAAEIMNQSPDPQDLRLPDTLRKAVHEALRASNVLRRLREFYRGTVADMTLIDIRELITEALASFEDRAAQLGVTITSDLALSREIQSDRTQLQMVFHNLLANALDAVAEVQSGTRHVHVTAATDHERLRVSVTDSGHGVAPDVREQLFKPFVTSKIDGMGLGLAISHSLLRSQGGELSWDGTYNAGTRFLVEIPLVSTRIGV